MATVSDKINQMLSINPNSKQYLEMRKELTSEEIIHLQKLLKRRSGEKYKMKKKGAPPKKESGNTDRKDLNDNILDIKELVAELLTIARSQQQNACNVSDSTTDETK